MRMTKPKTCLPTAAPRPRVRQFQTSGNHSMRFPRTNATRSFGTTFITRRVFMSSRSVLRSREPFTTRKKENDGDYHIQLKLDPKFSALLNLRNAQIQGEFIRPGHEANRGWIEIHPVSKIETVQ
jgi:hypothetical protein